VRAATVVLLVTATAALVIISLIIATHSFAELDLAGHTTGSAVGRLDTRVGSPERLKTRSARPVGRIPPLPDSPRLGGYRIP
jgi:hypothetical protein